MTTTFSVRADDQTRPELEELAKHAGSRNEAVNAAIHLAYRTMREESFRAEALELANDPDDLKEMREIRAEMDELRAW